MTSLHDQSHRWLSGHSPCGRAELEPKLAGRSLVPRTQRSNTTDRALF